MDAADVSWPKMEPPSGWVIVLLTTDPCPAEPSTRCVMSVVGPYRSHAEAKTAQASYPAAFSAHVVLLEKAES